MKVKSFKSHKTKKPSKQPNEPVYRSAELKQLMLIDTLLQYASLSQNIREEIESRVSGLTEGEASELIDFLNDNQACPILSGRNYQPTDIVKKLKNEI